MNKFPYALDKSELSQNQDDVIDMTTSRSDIYPGRMVLPTATSTYDEVNVDEEDSKTGSEGEGEKTDSRMDVEPYSQAEPDKLIAGNVEERSKDEGEQSEPKWFYSCY